MGLVRFFLGVGFFGLGFFRLFVCFDGFFRLVYLDSISPEEKESFDYLQKNTPDRLIYPTVHPAMRIEPRNQKEVLAIGQKAAYFTGTSHFVNIVENGGLHGYDGIIRLMEFIVDAYQNSKDASKLITIKGMNAGVCCL